MYVISRLNKIERGLFTTWMLIYFYFESFYVAKFVYFVYQTIFYIQRKNIYWDLKS